MCYIRFTITLRGVEMETVRVKPSELRDGDELLIEGVRVVLDKISREFDGYWLMFNGRAIFTNDKWCEEKVLTPGR